MSNLQDKLNIQIGSKLNVDKIYIEVIENGPYKVHGNAKIVQQFIIPNAEGISSSYLEGTEYKAEDGTMLCRCGFSKTKPYCDGSHNEALKNDLDLRETATFNPQLATAEIIEGPVISLTDDEKFCAYARFCDNGKRIWDEVLDNDKDSIHLSTKMAHLCPSGRLIVWNKNNQPIEKNKITVVFGLVEDIGNNCSGPIALWGAVPIKSAKGKFYEVRNRQTLCRCGESANKPFCDGTHASMNFQDELPKIPNVNGKNF
jgi:CDGSH-type Zn-finger protein